jgi:DNA-binding CsgD family transcriptional regulator/tetratricopeptide (TPR) repeat protein
MALLERASQLQDLEDLLHRARKGSGCLAIVTGEAGSGKTSLVDLLTARVGSPTRVMIGACDALSTPRPLGPLFDVAAAFGTPVRRLLRDAERGYELFAAILEDLAAGPPALFVIEDAHWADEATLDLLRYLGRRIEGTRAVLLVTYRNDEVNSRHPLQFVLGDLATRKSVYRMHLPPLSLDAVQVLSAGSSLDAIQLHRRTGGNAFYVTEVIGAGSEEIPETVRDAVLTRAARLSAAGREALEAAAVAGERIESWLIDSVTGDSVVAMDECLEAGLLRVADGTLQFRHELTRQAVLDAISPVKSRRLHGQVLASLRSRQSFGNDLATIAHHAEAAGDGAAVLEFAPAAAARASRLGAHREAAAQYGRALRHCPPDSCGQRLVLLERWYSESYDTGHFQDAMDAANELAGLARAVPDPAREARWLAAEAKSHIVFGDNAGGERIMAHALALVEGMPPTGFHAAVYRTEASIRMLNRDCEEAILLGQRAMDLSSQFDDDEGFATAIGIVGSARIVSGDIERGRFDLEQSLSLARASGHVSAAAVAYTNLGSGLAEMYQFADAERYLTDGIAYTIASDLDAWRGYMTSWLALVRLYQGRWAEATDLAESVRSDPRANALARIMALVAMGRVRARRGDPEAGSALDEAQVLAEPTGTLQRVAPVRAARAEAAWITGRPDVAVAEARAAHGLAIAHGHRWHIGELSYWRWLGGDLDEPHSASAAPWLLQMQGEHREAASMWRDLGCPYEAARALAGSDDEGLLREAFATFDTLGARPAAASVVRRMRKLGHRAIPRGARPTTRDNPARLTRRELQVLGLISTGSTNMDIANQLFLSPKTIEHHVSAILGKLQVSTRQEAVRAAKTGGAFQSEGIPGPT